MSRLVRQVFFCLSLVFPVTAGADTFDTIKSQLRKAECAQIRFRSIVSSTIFESSDTLDGSALFELGGKYRITLGNDRYIFDGRELYSYSYDNNQVAVERVDPNEQFGAEVSFVTRLDEIYKTRILRPDSTYRLVKSARGYANVPDSMVVTIDKKAGMIRKIEYRDINDEPTTIQFLEQSLARKCNPKDFAPDFPDSVQVIRLK